MIFTRFLMKFIYPHTKLIKDSRNCQKLSILLEHLHDKFSALMKSKIEPLVKVSLEDTEKDASQSR